MPFYEYECTDCSHRFEELQGISEDPIECCPECQGKVKRLISICCTHVSYNNPREYYEKVIKPDAKRTADKIKDGDENEAANFFGAK